jgi:hypothetical protein
MLQLDIRSKKTAISGTTVGPCTVSTRSLAGAGAGADVAAGVTAGAGATRAAVGAVARWLLMLMLPVTLPPARADPGMPLEGTGTK